MTGVVPLLPCSYKFSGFEVRFPRFLFAMFAVSVENVFAVPFSCAFFPPRLDIRFLSSLLNRANPFSFLGFISGFLLNFFEILVEVMSMFIEHDATHVKLTTSQILCNQYFKRVGHFSSFCYIQPP